MGFFACGKASSFCLREEDYIWYSARLSHFTKEILPVTEADRPKKALLLSCHF